MRLECWQSDAGLISSDSIGMGGILNAGSPTWGEEIRTIYRATGGRFFTKIWAQNKDGTKTELNTYNIPVKLHGEEAITRDFTIGGVSNLGVE